jgi:hypothetical protein
MICCQSRSVTLSCYLDHVWDDMCGHGPWSCYGVGHSLWRFHGNVGNGLWRVRIATPIYFNTPFSWCFTKQLLIFMTNWSTLDWGQLSLHKYFPGKKSINVKPICQETDKLFIFLYSFAWIYYKKIEWGKE